MCLKVNVIAQVEFEFAYYKVTVQYVNHYAMRSLTFLGKGNFIFRCDETYWLRDHYSFIPFFLEIWPQRADTIFCILHMQEY